MEHLTPEQAEKGCFMPVKEGIEWGHTWEYMWMRARVVLPEAAQGERIVMSLDVGGEATLFC